jgi:hypothetical protein
MTIFEIIITAISSLATIGVFTALYRIGKKIGHFEESAKNLNNSIEKLPCGQRATEMQNIHDDVLAIKTFLATKHKNTEAVWGLKHSPTTLNENGEKLFNSINGKDFLEKNKDFLLKKLSEKNPKTALDVETESHSILIENTDNDIFNGLKNWVYNSPTMSIKDKDEIKEYTITLYDVCYVLSIPLRDMYLQLHPEILQSENQQ